MRVCLFAMGIFVLAGCATRLETMESMMSYAHAGSVMSAGAKEVDGAIVVTSASVVRGGTPFVGKVEPLAYAQTSAVHFKVLGPSDAFDSQVASRFARKFSKGLDRALENVWGNAERPELDISLILVPVGFSFRDSRQTTIRNGVARLAFYDTAAVLRDTETQSITISGLAHEIYHLMVDLQQINNGPARPRDITRSQHIFLNEASAQIFGSCTAFESTGRVSLRFEPSVTIKDGNQVRNSTFTDKKIKALL